MNAENEVVDPNRAYTVGCRLAHLVPDRTHAAAIEDAVTRVHRATFLATELANLHLQDACAPLSDPSMKPPTPRSPKNRKRPGGGCSCNSRATSSETRPKHTRHRRCTAHGSRPNVLHSALTQRWDSGTTSRS